MDTAHRERSDYLFAQQTGDREADLVFDNSGKNPILVPGFGHAVAIEREPGQRFAHGFSDWAQNRLTAREVAILNLMDNITDRPRWDVDIQDAVVVARWASEALALPLISQAAWDWCLAELRDKAFLSQDTGLVDVYDSAARVCKSDTVISARLLGDRASGVDEIARCRSVECGKPMPGSTAPLEAALGVQHHASAQELVDPNLFPLVYGQTRVLSHGGRVGLLGAIEAIGQGTVAPKREWERHTLGGHHGNIRRVRRDWVHSFEPIGDRFSSSFQWLPCEVEFPYIRAATSEDLMVRISSYINNLHPRQYRLLYAAIEQCIAASIEPWNRVLVWRDRGRVPERIRTFGPLWEPQYPEWAENLDDLPKDRDHEDYQDAWSRVRDYLQQQDNPRAPPPRLGERLLDSDWEYNISLGEAVSIKYNRIKHWAHPEPGVSFTYEQWKAGKNNHAVVPGHGTGRLCSLPPEEDHQFYTVSLEKMFGKQGLQVVVEIGSIELTPEQPIRAATDWGLSGGLNEHIVATTIIFFSSTNVTLESASFFFRVEADLDPTTHIYGPASGSSPLHPFEPLGGIYGVEPTSDLGDTNYNAASGCPAMQEMGPVRTPDGRCLTFPNVMQHQMGACELLDPTKPGRRRFLRLHLVDPHYRLCSTRNVPPQRQDWWAEAGVGRIAWGRRGVPQEIQDMIGKEVGEWPMGLAEATRLGVKVLDEHRVMHAHAIDAVCRYGFAPWAWIGDAWV